MSRFTSTIPPDYFDAMYAADPDPWRFAESEYERAKYAATLAALPREHYRNALEVGCSIGVLTRQIAARCADLLAVDIAANALDQARRRCTDLSHVRFERCRIPDDWPVARYDLILLSEMVYYLDEADVARLADRVRATTAPGADLVLVHWLGETHYPLSGDEAAELFTKSSAAFAEMRYRHRTDEYRLDVLRCRETGSDAAR